MALYLNNLGIKLPNGLSKHFHVQGLENFRSTLEKDFFSRVTINKCASSETETKLVVELVCGINLAELLHHFNRGEWGNFGINKSSITSALHKLREDNNHPIEIEELSLILNGTSIIINRINEDSISKQLHNILTELGNHYVHFTKGLREIPFEIYVPVFEEPTLDTESTLVDITAGNKHTQEYFSFWGLYFESSEDALIYDLKNLSHISGDLFMLSH